MKMMAWFLFFAAGCVSLCVADDVNPNEVPPPRAAREGEMPAEPRPGPGTKMLGPNLLTVGEKVVVVGVNERPAPVYEEIKLVGYLEPRPEERTLVQLKRVSGSLWARLDSMREGTWVQVSALQLLREVQIGMTKAQVFNRIGKPTKINLGVDGEEWVFEAYQVLVDRKLVEGREKHSALIPVIDPKGGTVTVVPTYTETVKRYTVENPYWAKVLDKRFVFRDDKLVGVVDLQGAPPPPKQ
jgi:hypothetical protein